MGYPKEGCMTLLFSHGLMNANMFDTISLYVYWHGIYRTYMLTIYVCMVIDMKYNYCEWFM